MSDSLTVVVEDNDTITLEVAEQGTPGSCGITIFATTTLMNATTGTAGEVAYCTDFPDQHWKWNTVQAAWVPAF